MEIRQAILKAADHIEANPGAYDFGEIFAPDSPGCGTPGCAVGWIACFRGMKKRTDYDTIWGAGSERVIGVDSNRFTERMNVLSDNWTFRAVDCAATLRLYADKYFPVVNDDNETSPEHGTPEHFWSRVDIRGEDDCWLWTGSLGKCGYGSVRFRGEYSSAHRLAYQLSKGEIPNGLLVMHSCDVRECCNPSHLSVGTHQDNADDMVAKGRATQRGERGSKNGFSKLCEADVLDIHGQIKSGVRTTEIAQQFNVSEQAIYAIRSGRNWGWLTGLDNPAIRAELDRIANMQVERAGTG